MKDGKYEMRDGSWFYTIEDGFIVEAYFQYEDFRLYTASDVLANPKFQKAVLKELSAKDWKKGKGA